MSSTSNEVHPVSIKTTILALHSIQKNMLGIERSRNYLTIPLASGKELIITAPDDNGARHIERELHFYPSEGERNNSRDMTFEFKLEVR